MRENRAFRYISEVTVATAVQRHFLRNAIIQLDTLRAVVEKDLMDGLIKPLCLFSRSTVNNKNKASATVLAGTPSVRWYLVDNAWY